jgi:hypothetical protein
VDQFAKLRSQKARDELEARHDTLRALVAELVATADGAFYRRTLVDVPDGDWRAFHFELMHALRVPTPPSYDPRTLPLSGLPHIREKADLLADEHRARLQNEARGRVEKLARTDVPGVTGSEKPRRFPPR